MPGQKREARLRADVPGIHVFNTLWYGRRGWPGAQTNVRSLRKADYYARA
jgi:hypothetical protein